MKKFLPYILIILLLAGAVTWFALHKTTGTNDTEESAFAVKDGKSISKIVLTDTDKKKIELMNTNGIWMVNGKFAAREELIQSLLEAITRVTTLCPVPKAAHDNVIREMLARNVKVEIYAGNVGKSEKTYYVGGPTTDGEGTHMLLEENGKMAARPYITYIPGLHGYLTLRFNTDEENWRTKVLFNYKEADIKSLSIEYFADEKNSFTINRLTKDSFGLMPKLDKFIIKDTYRQQFIRQYLNFYSSISFESFDNNYSKKDSMMHTIPYCIITITESDGSANKARLFHMPLSQRSKLQFDDKGNEMAYDIDHYHAAIHDDKDFVIVQYYVFGKILRNYKDFFFKPATRSVK